MNDIANISAHTIYYNALPYYQERIDLMGLDALQPERVEGWFEAVLDGKSAEMSIDASGLVADKLRHLYFQGKNLERTGGSRMFGLGFPLLVDTNATDLVFAPLFVQPLHLEPAIGKMDQWVLQFQPFIPPVPNLRLLRHLKLKYDLDLFSKADNLVRRAGFSKETILAFCNEVVDQLGFAFDQPGSLALCPGIDEIGNCAVSGALQWSGVIGLYPPQDREPGKTLPKPEKIFRPQALSTSEEALVYTHNQPDPEKVSAQAFIARNKVSVLEVAVNKKHIQVAVNLLLQALSEGERCLVVSPSSAALVHLQKALSATGLLQLHYLLDDAVNDALPFVGLLQSIHAGMNQEIPFSEVEFTAKRNAYLRATRRFDAAFHSVRQPVFGPYSREEATGLFLASNQKEGKELLGSQLDPRDFDFTFEEYKLLKKETAVCQRLFDKVNTLVHPLTVLHPAIFAEIDKGVGREQIGKRIEAFHDKAAQLHHLFIAGIDGYASRLRKHYEEKHQYFGRRALALQDSIAANTDRFGSQFKNSGGGWSKLFRLFTMQRKELSKSRNGIVKRYEQLSREFENNRLFEFDFKNCRRGKDIACIAECTADFQHQLKNRGATVDAIVQDELMRLNHKTTLPALEYKEQVQDLELGLDSLLDELNEARLFKQHFENKTLTLLQRQKYLETLIELLETTHLNLRDFDDFCDWQQKWLQLNECGQRVVRALAKVKPASWAAAFESWYLNNVLQRDQPDHLPVDDSALLAASDAWHALHPLVLNQIRALWQKRQAQVLKSLRKQRPDAVNRLFSKKKRKGAELPDLALLFEDAVELITSFFPVLFVTPHVAMNVLPSVKEAFRFIVFEESNQFQVEQATAIAPLGRQYVICGRNDGLGAETSLIQYALDNDVPSMNIHDHLSEMEELYGSAAGSMEHCDLQVHRVDGRFNELDGVNEAEAQYILRLLMQVERSDRRIYPAIGIVTFTVGQRNLIQSLLLKIKQEHGKGSEKILQLERNGMGVFYLGELYGHHFDQLLVSSTFGSVNQQTTLTKKVALLDTPGGASGMRNLVAMDASKMVFVHSLPDNFLLNARRNKNKTGSWYFSSLIALALAKMNGYREGAVELSEALQLRLPENNYQPQFLVEIGKALVPYIEEKRLEVQNAVFRLHKLLCIHPVHKGQLPVWVVADGMFSLFENSSAVWEYRLREQLETKGFLFQSAWSLNWLKNANQEARVLASFIIQKDERQPDRESEEVRVDDRKKKDSKG